MLVEGAWDDEDDGDVEEEGFALGAELGWLDGCGEGSKDGCGLGWLEG